MPNLYLKPGPPLVIGGTSFAMSTPLDVGDNRLTDEQWAEINRRYSRGLEPHFTSGRLEIRHEIDLPDDPVIPEGTPSAAPDSDEEGAHPDLLDGPSHTSPPEEGGAAEVEEPPPSPASAASPSLDGVSCRKAEPIISDETDEETLLDELTRPGG